LDKVGLFRLRKATLRGMLLGVLGRLRWFRFWEAKGSWEGWVLRGHEGGERLKHDCNVRGQLVGMCLGWRYWVRGRDIGCVGLGGGRSKRMDAELI